MKRKEKPAATESESDFPDGEFQDNDTDDDDNQDGYDVSRKPEAKVTKKARRGFKVFQGEKNIKEREMQMKNEISPYNSSQLLANITNIAAPKKLPPGNLGYID